MAGIWDFLGGAAATHLNTVDERDKAKAEEKRLKMLDALQRDTKEWEMKKLDEQEGKKIDTKLSYPDYAAGVYRAVNSRGERIPSADRPLTTSEIKANELELAGRGLDIDLKKAQIADIPINNAFQRESLDIQRRASRGGGLDSGGPDEVKKGRLYGLANTVEKSISSLGAPAGYVARIRSELYNGINQGWTEKDLRDYEASAIRTLVAKKVPDKWDVINRRLELERAAAAAAIKPPSN